MRTLAVGSNCLRTRRLPTRCQRGFTLLELMVVVAIIAIATAGVSLSLRDSAQTQVEREAVRLAALLESARAQSRTSGVAVVWQATAQGFRFEGMEPQTLPNTWLHAGTRALAQGPLQAPAQASNNVQANGQANGQVTGQSAEQITAQLAGQAAAHLVLGPEPMLPRQGVTLFNQDQPNIAWRVQTDGLQPFQVVRSAEGEAQ
jgi:general secretion pathway protein H